MTPEMNRLVLGFGVGVSVLAGLLSGLAPALQASRPSVTAELRQGARGAASSRRLLARGLVVAEVALALVMLSGAGLFIRGLRDWQQIDPGFKVENLLTVRLALPQARVFDEGMLADLPSRLRARVANVPGVRATAVTSILPLGNIPPKALLTIDGRQPADVRERINATVLSVSPGYLLALGVPLMEGREFTNADRRDAEPVVLVNEDLRRLHWPDETPLGQRVTVRGRSREIVGVLGTVRHDMFLVRGAVEPIMYLPQAQEPRLAWIMARTAPGASDLGTAIRAAVQEVDPDATIQVRAMTDVLAQRLSLFGLISGLLGGFGALATILAAIGVYGVMAFTVSRRHGEMGVRMALGARRRDLLGLVLWEEVWLAALGFALGVPGVLLVSRVVQSALFGVDPWVSGTVVLAGLALFLVAMVASYVPARRAAGVEPMRALRSE